MDAKPTANPDMYANYKKKALKNAKEGEVVTRFPPEPSGYLHVGHVKAAMLNFHYAKMFGGRMLLRFDDTNPQAEKEEFVENIKRDLKTLDIVPDQVSHTSDHFDKLIELMKQLIGDGNAYADNSSGAEMKNQRDNGIESPHRGNSVDFNLKIFDEMLAGKVGEWQKDENGELKKWCIRAKMNMQDKFKCLRDPVFFRVQLDIPHHKTGTKYKAYPTYDYACPVVDSLEGVTHALRSAEYTDRSNGYSWVHNKLNLRPVAIAEFARLNFKSTCLSKRKLKWIIEQGIVDGWDDPRFPTVQGIMRHGMEVRALTNFMLENGASRKDVNMEWDKIWAINKDIIDPVVPRYSAIAKGTSAELVLTNGPAENYFETKPLHPKNAAVGTKPLEYGSVLYLEKADANEVAVGEKITLMKWGNAVVTDKEAKDGVLTLKAELKLDDKDVKGTKKLTWVAKSETNLLVNIRELDHIITKERVEEEDAIADIVNRNSSIMYPAIAEGNLRTLKQGDKIQIERRGYFQVDNVEMPGDSGKPMTLIFIPDGKQKNMSAISSAIDQKQLAAGKKKDKGGKGGDAPKKDTADGEEADGEKKLSKKELNKLKRKEKQTAAKAATKAGGPSGGTATGGAESGASAIVASADMTYGTIPAELSQALGFCEKALAAKHYLNGDRLTSLDKDYHDKIVPHQAKVSAMTHPYTAAWFGFVSKFTDAARATWPKVDEKSAAPAQKAGKAAGKGDKKKKDEDEVDMDDLFGDDDPAEAEAAKKVQDAAKANATKKKKVVIAMSLVLLEVKPVDDTTDLDALAQRLFTEITQEGLYWKTEYKKEPVAFGIFKLIVGFSLEDAKVSVDDVVERIEGLEDMVQSVEIQAFNKI